MRRMDGANRPEAICLARTRRGATHVDANYGTIVAFEENCCAARDPHPVRCVADEHTWHVAEVIQQGALRVHAWGRFWHLPLVWVGGNDPWVVPGQGAEGE